MNKEDIIPSWLKVDIIPLDFAPSYLVDRILHKTQMPENKKLKTIRVITEACFLFID